MTRSSKIQLARIPLYWTVLTLGFAILFSVLFNTLNEGRLSPSILSTLVIATAVISGTVFSVLLYFLRDRQVLEYDKDGYRITKGRSNVTSHKWKEFKECSIARDGYGKLRVRAYEERDGRHFDIDSAACGMDPFALRDFILGCISSRKIARQLIFEGLEREIQRGRASWVADLTETFKDYQLSGEVFPIIARGGTRPKGFLLSRFVAFTLMPHYNVCLNACGFNVGESKSDIMRLVRIIETQRDQKDIKWSWLLLFSEDDPNLSTAKLIEEFGNRDIGLGFINMISGNTITSPNQLGRSLKKQMRMNRLIHDIQSRRPKYA